MNPSLVRSADFAEVEYRFKQENSRSKAFDWTLGQLEKTQRELPDQWKLENLSKSEILGVMVHGGHNHSIPGAPPLIEANEVVSIAGALERLQAFEKEKMPCCWKNISSQKERDISQTHLFLKRVEGKLWHIDGFHRMLAWLLFQGDGTLSAFVAG